MSRQVKNQYPTILRQIRCDVLPGAAAVIKTIQEYERRVGIRIADFNPVQINPTRNRIEMTCSLHESRWG